MNLKGFPFFSKKTFLAKSLYKYKKFYLYFYDNLIHFSKNVDCTTTKLIVLDSLLQETDTLWGLCTYRSLRAKNLKMADSSKMDYMD